MKRRTGIRIAVAFVVLAVTYTAGWHILASMAERRVSEAVEPAPDRAWHAAWERLETTGMPFAFQVTAFEPEIVWGDGERRVSWSGPGLLLDILPWHPDRVSLELPERQFLDVLDGVRRQSFTVLMESGRIDVAFPSGRLDVLDAGFSGVAVSFPDGAAAMSADTIELDARSTGDGRDLDVSLQATGLVSDGLAVAGLGDRVDRARLALRRVGELARDGTARERVDAWRRAGGYVELGDLSVEWPPVVAKSRGNLALDGDMRPVGALRLELAGYRELLLALEAAERLRPGQASLVAAVLDVLAGPPVDGLKRLDIDVSIGHGMLSIGPFAVMPVGSLWPAEGTAP